MGGESSDLISNYSAGLLQTGQTKKAIENIEKLNKKSQITVNAFSNYLLAIQYDDEWSREERFAQATKFSDIFEKPLKQYRININKRNHYEKIKIGYVSGDFRNHSLAYFIEPILKNHNKNKFEIYCYSNHPVEDEVTSELKKYSDSWLNCSNMTDEDLARKISIDSIDILIDLSGHTGYNRLLVFARKPAPLQMTWLGYQATTGLESIDYRITEESLDPVGTSEKFHSEKLIRLSSSGAFNPIKNSPLVNELPSLKSNYFIYGCLNNPSKITDEIICLWAEILKRNKKSKLLLGNVSRELRLIYIRKFEKLNITSDRLILKEKTNVLEYLSIHNEIDIALDTFPYNGGTTTYHSLWMGVPVIVLDGDSTLSRVGVSIMKGVGLHQFCTSTLEAYVEKAVYFSFHTNELNEVRKNLRKNVNILNERLAKEVTKSLEESFELTWNKYLNDKSSN